MKTRENLLGRQTNNYVNIMRIVCAWLVVAIHTHPLTDINIQAGFFATEIITRVAVPFFFLVSGYYYCQKIRKDRNYIKTYIKGLLSSYCVWSAIYYLVNLSNAINDNDFSVKSYIIDCVVRFLLYGSYYHLWYIPALFIAVFIVTFVEKIKGRKILIVLSLIAYIVGVFGCAYYQLGIKLPGLNVLYQMQNFETVRRVLLMGVPFFAAGYIVPYISDKIKKKWNMAGCLLGYTYF